MCLGEHTYVRVCMCLLVTHRWFFVSSRHFLLVAKRIRELFKTFNGSCSADLPTSYLGNVKAIIA